VAAPSSSLLSQLARRKPGEPHPFVDNAAWRRWLDVAEAGAVKYADEEKQKAERARWHSRYLDRVTQRAKQ